MKAGESNTLGRYILRKWKRERGKVKRNGDIFGHMISSKVMFW